MRAPCEERGADLFLLARDRAEPDAATAAHLAACEGCREELVHLRRLAGALPAASRGLRPRPSTKTDLMKEVEAALAAEEAAPPPRRAPSPLLSFWVPAGALAASLLVTVWALQRNGPPPAVSGAGGDVTVRTIFGGPALEGLLPSGLPAGAELAAREVASVHLGPPFDAEVVLGKDARLSLPPRPEGGRSLRLLRGTAWFSPGPGAPLAVRAGEVDVRGSSPFTVELRGGGVVTAIAESGTLAVASGGGSVEGRGPCRVEAEPGGRPGEPVPAEPSDASAWFAYPDLLLELPAPAPGRAREMVLTLRPSVPREIRIAPWDRFGTLFTLRVTHPEKGLSDVPLRGRAVSRPAPVPAGDGTFALGADRPYRLHVDPAALGLAPGRYRVEAVYAAHRSGGTWRGTRASNTVELVVE